jgi:hypothetical protein
MGIAMESTRRRKEAEARKREEMARRNAQVEAREAAERQRLAALVAARQEAARRLEEFEAVRQVIEQRRQAALAARGKAEQYQETMIAAQEMAEQTHKALGVVAAAVAAAAARASLRDAQRRYRERNLGLQEPSEPELVSTQENTSSKNLWEKAKRWIQDRVEPTILHPPSWLGISYHAGSSSFSLRDYASNEFVSYQPQATNLLEQVTYQRVALQADMNFKITSNPSASLDINFANGRITFRGRPDANGVRVNYFIQPGSLSFGTISSRPLQSAMVPESWQAGSNVSVTTYDFDLFGKNWCSFKASQMNGTKLYSNWNIDEGNYQLAETERLGGSMQVHRYPRFVAFAGGAALVYKAGAIILPIAGSALEYLGGIFRNPAWQH